MILGADGKPVVKVEPSSIEATYRANLRTAIERNNRHFLELMARGLVEDRVRLLRQSCGVKVRSQFAYVTKDEEE